MTESIDELAKEWLRIDKDPDTREEIQNLVAEKNNEELEKRLRNRINFGTAGLRARMEAGFSRMNAVTVIQTSQGLAEYLLEKVPRARKSGVVIGRDGRHHSDKFARLTAAAFVQKQFKIWWYEPPVHTPMVPFGVQELGAAAGVMITASHNPAQDNGYKVYWSNSCQIVPPHDEGIAESILRNLEPLSWDEEVVDQSLLVEGSLDLVEENYYNAVCEVADPKLLLQSDVDKHLDFAYTAMHGVGLRYMNNVVKRLGVEKHMKVVQEQAHPDPNFPGLPYPNPEERGALDVAMWSADRNSVDLILATDPDADRLAVAEKVDGKWHTFSGNDVGMLFAVHILSIYDGPRDKLAMIASTVSSQMLAHVAQKEGFRFFETLTGFKWMGNKALELEEEGFDVRFAFEESIGYMFPRVVHDKDGIVAAAAFIAAAAKWRREKELTPYAVLQQAYKKFGYFEEANTYLRSPSPAVTEKVFSSVRALGNPHPKALGKRKILKWRDLTLGWDSSTPDHKPLLPVDSSSQMITCVLEGSVRMTVRASGTEPKIKVYIECHSMHKDQARRNADDTLGDLMRDWLKPRENDLVLA